MLCYVMFFRNHLAGGEAKTYTKIIELVQLMEMEKGTK